MHTTAHSERRDMRLRVKILNIPLQFVANTNPLLAETLNLPV